jgi:hypothetical protein
LVTEQVTAVVLPLKRQEPLVVAAMALPIKHAGGLLQDAWAECMELNTASTASKQAAMFTALLLGKPIDALLQGSCSRLSGYPPMQHQETRDTSE